MRGTAVAFVCLFVLSTASPRRTSYWPPGGEWRLHRICKRYGENPVRDYLGRIRQCYWSRPSCPWGSRCRYGYSGYDVVCCRRNFYPYRRDGGFPYDFPYDNNVGGYRN